MMRKIMSVFLSALLSLLTVFTMTTVAQVNEVIIDEATGVAYTISSRVIVDGHYSISYEGKIFDDTAYYFHEDILGIGAEGFENDRVQETVRKCKEQGEHAVRTAYNPERVRMLCPVMNQEEYAVPTERLPDYYRLFGIDDTFNGVMIVEKEGIPFTVKGDGNGALTLQVKTDLQGKQTKTLRIPCSSTYQSMEYIGEHYTAVITKRNTDNLNDIVSFDSLEELLAHCAEYAVLDDPINIHGYIQYNVKYEAFVTNNVNLEVEYGNLDYESLQTTRATTSSAKVTQADKSSETQGNVTTVVSDDSIEMTTTATSTTIVPTTTTLSTNTTVARTTTALQTTTTKTTQKTQSHADENENGHESVVLWILLPCGAVVVAGAVWYFRFYRKVSK